MNEQTNEQTNELLVKDWQWQWPENRPENWKKPEHIDTRTPDGIKDLVDYYREGLSFLIEKKQEQSQLPEQRYKQKARFEEEIYTLLGINAALKDTKRKRVGFYESTRESTPEIIRLQENAKSLVEIVNEIKKLPSVPKNAPSDETWRIHTLHFDWEPMIWGDYWESLSPLELIESSTNAQKAIMRKRREELAQGQAPEQALEKAQEHAWNK